MNNEVDNQNGQALNNGRSGLRWLGIVAAGIGIGSAIAYLFSRTLGAPTTPSRSVPEHIVDDRGTGQDKAARMLRNLRDRGFEASDERLALALGRGVEEIAGWSAGREVIDDDVVMKARGIALNRGIHIE